MVGLTLLLEACRILQGYLKTQASANPLTYAQTESRISETSPLLRPLMIPASPSIIKKRRYIYENLETLSMSGGNIYVDVMTNYTHICNAQAII